MVLIETLWNVNLTRSVETAGCFPCFNRNIVECKLEMPFSILELFVGLIETLWNVNLTIHMTQKSLEKRFNRNIVECKYF